MAFRTTLLFYAFMANFLDGGGKAFSWKNIQPIYHSYLYDDGKMPKLDKDVTKFLDKLKDDECLGGVYYSDYLGASLSIWLIDKHHHWYFYYDLDNFDLDKSPLSISKKKISELDYYGKSSLLNSKVYKWSDFVEFVNSWNNSHASQEDMNSLKKSFFDSISLKVLNKVDN